MGYEYEKPELMTSFSASISRSPAFAIKYSDDDEEWKEAYSTSASSQNPSASWSRSHGAHKFWRYELTGDWSGGPWYNKLMFHRAQDCDPTPGPCSLIESATNASCDLEKGLCYTTFTPFVGGHCTSHCRRNV